MRVLFIDDEPNVLQGLKRMLHPLRGEWEMEFAESGLDALAILAKSPCDVVVTDIRMPGMDGVELLEEVRNRYPRTVRVVLSGQAGKDEILRSVGPIHQYLSKPCDPQTLQSTLVLCRSLQGLLADDKLRGLISQVEALPSLPEHYKELMAEITSADPSTKKVGQIISKDVGMTAKVLQLVNSAFFGLRQRVSNPAQAAVMLGLDVVKALMLSAHVFAQFDKAEEKNAALKGLWDHSVAAGAFANRIADIEDCSVETRDHALIGGLMHDVGKLVLASKLPDEYLNALDHADREGGTQVEAERELLRATHAEVGAYLMGLWGLATPIVEALAFHHQPKESQSEGFMPLTAVHVADVIANEDRSASVPGAAAEVDGAYLNQLGLSDRLADWRTACKAASPEEGESCQRRFYA